MAYKVIWENCIHHLILISFILGEGCMVPNAQNSVNHFAHGSVPSLTECEQAHVIIAEASDVVKTSVGYVMEVVPAHVWVHWHRIWSAPDVWIHVIFSQVPCAPNGAHFHILFVSVNWGNN